MMMAAKLPARFQDQLVIQSGYQDDTKELWSEIWNTLMGYINDDDSPNKLQQKGVLVDLMSQFLSRVAHDSKFYLACTAPVLRDSLERSGCRPLLAAQAFEALHEYAVRLLAQPWRPEFTRINLYSGYYVHTVQSRLAGAHRLVEEMGYRVDAASQTATLREPVDVDQVTKAAIDTLMASVECRLIERILEDLPAGAYTPLGVLCYRTAYVGGAEAAVHHLNVTLRQRNFQRYFSPPAESAAYPWQPAPRPAAAAPLPAVPTGRLVELADTGQPWIPKTIGQERPPLLPATLDQAGEEPALDSWDVLQPPAVDSLDDSWGYVLGSLDRRRPLSGRYDNVPETAAAGRGTGTQRAATLPGPRPPPRSSRSEPQQTRSTLANGAEPERGDGGRPAEYSPGPRGSLPTDCTDRAGRGNSAEHIPAPRASLPTDYRQMARQTPPQSQSQHQTPHQLRHQTPNHSHQQTAQQTVQQTNQHPAHQSHQQTAQQTNQHPAHQSHQQTAQQTNQHPAHQSHQQTAQQTNQHPAHQSHQQTAQQTNQHPAHQSHQQTAKHTNQQTKQQAARQSHLQTNQHTAQQSQQQPNQQASLQSQHQENQQTAHQSFHQGNKATANQSHYQANKPTANQTPHQGNKPSGSQLHHQTPSQKHQEERPELPARQPAGSLAGEAGPAPGGESLMPRSSSLVSSYGRGRRPEPGPEPRRPQLGAWPQPEQPEQEEQWSCHACTYLNPLSVRVCAMCGKSRRSPPPAAAPPPPAEPPDDLACPQCTLLNSRRARRCGACEADLQTAH